MGTASRPSATAERTYRELCEWALREYLNAIAAAQARAADFAHTPTFRDAGATSMHRRIADYMTSQYGAEPEEPKVDKASKRVASVLESEAVPESWLARLGDGT